MSLTREEQGRLLKSMKLADALTKSGCSSEVAAVLDDEGWDHAAAVAGTRLPSEKTKDMVVRLLAHREEEEGKDPFRFFKGP